jgi:hypothetical protein
VPPRQCHFPLALLLLLLLLLLRLGVGVQAPWSFSEDTTR